MSDAVMGRPRIEIDWDQVDKLLFIQCTQEEIAAFFECSIDTLNNRSKEVNGITFSEYSAQKRQKGRASLRRRQWQLMEAGNVVMNIWLGKQYLGQAEKQEVRQENHGQGAEALNKLAASIVEAAKLANEVK